MSPESPRTPNGSCGAWRSTSADQPAGLGAEVVARDRGWRGDHPRATAPFPTGLESAHSAQRNWLRAAAVANSVGSTGKAPRSADEAGPWADPSAPQKARAGGYASRSTGVGASGVRPGLDSQIPLAPMREVPQRANDSTVEPPARGLRPLPWNVAKGSMVPSVTSNRSTPAGCSRSARHTRRSPDHC